VLTHMSPCGHAILRLQLVRDTSLVANSVQLPKAVKRSPANVNAVKLKRQGAFWGRPFKAANAAAHTHGPGRRV
jgi:hypothetical protein